MEASPFASFAVTEEAALPTADEARPPRLERRSCDDQLLRSGGPAAAAPAGSSVLRPFGTTCAQPEFTGAVPVGEAQLQRRHSIGDPNDVTGMLSHINNCHLVQQRVPPPVPLVATVGTSGLATLPDGRVALQPSGPRQAGQGCEEIEQGVVVAEPLPNGSGAMLRITLLAAGFVLGQLGSSVREISRVTGANIKSWTTSPDAVCVRPTRQFVVEGGRASVAAALAIVCDAVQRYKELCEGKYAGQSVARVQHVSGVDFIYQPPPRHVVPFAASLRGQGGRRHGHGGPSAGSGSQGSPHSRSESSSSASSTSCCGANPSPCPAASAQAGASAPWGSGKPPMHPSFKDALTRASSASSQALGPGTRSPSGSAAPPTAPHQPQHDATYGSCPAPHEAGCGPPPPAAAGGGALSLSRSASLPTPPRHGANALAALHAPAGPPATSGSPPQPASAGQPSSALAGSSSSRTGSLARAASEGDLPPFHTPAPTNKLEKEDVLSRVFGVLDDAFNVQPHNSTGSACGGINDSSLRHAVAALLGLQHQQQEQRQLGHSGDAAALLVPAGLTSPATLSPSAFAPMPLGDGIGLAGGLPPDVHRLLEATAATASGAAHHFPPLQVQAGTGSAGNLSALAAAIGVAQQRQAQANDQLRQLAALVPPSLAAAAAGPALTPTPTPAASLPCSSGLRTPAYVPEGSAFGSSNAAAAAAHQQQLLAALQALQLQSAGPSLEPMTAATPAFGAVGSPHPPMRSFNAAGYGSARSSPGGNCSSSPGTPRGQPTLAQAATPGDAGLYAAASPGPAYPPQPAAFLGAELEAHPSPFAATFVPPRWPSQPGSPGSVSPPGYQPLSGMPALLAGCKPAFAGQHTGMGMRSPPPSPHKPPSPPGPCAASTNNPPLLPINRSNASHAIDILHPPFGGSSGSDAASWAASLPAVPPPASVFSMLSRQPSLGSPADEIWAPAPQPPPTPAGAGPFAHASLASPGGPWGSLPPAPSAPTSSAFASAFGAPPAGLPPADGPASLCVGQCRGGLDSWAAGPMLAPAEQAIIPPQPGRSPSSAGTAGWAQLLAEAVGCPPSGGPM